jgi:ATP-dependent protease Clp ATPase subunit
MAATACCFCGRTVDQVTHLVQGPDLFICDICVDACVDTLATKDHGWRARQIDYLLRLRNRRTLPSPPSSNEHPENRAVGDNE